MKGIKKIGLVAVNSRRSHSNPTLFAIRTMLLRRGETDPRMIELTINDNWREALAKLAEMDCGFYLFSVYIWNRDFIRKILPLLKALKPESRMVLGGPEISWNREKWTGLYGADLLVKGQAEDFVPSLLTCGDSFFESKHTPINDIPFPYLESDRETLSGRLVYFEASRGCLFNCSYCLSACSSGQPEYRDLNRVKEEMRRLISLNPKIVKMVDRTFNSNRSYAREIWRFLIEEKPSVPFHFEIHPVFLEDEDFSILAGAPDGLFFFEVGIQSTDREVLAAVNRPWNRDREKESIDRLCSLPNIHTHLDQIVGLPSDSPEKAALSFNDILSHKPDEFQLGFLKVLPGTPLGNRTGELGLKYAPFPPYEIIETPDFHFNELAEFHRLEADLGRFYNSGYFRMSLEYLISIFGGPWKFFQRLSTFAPENRQTKRWAELGQSLLQLVRQERPSHTEHLIDLLRYDWCPYSSGQSYPPFLRLDSDMEIKERRRTLYSCFERLIEGFTRREYNHSILYIPSGDMMMKKLGTGSVLFYRRDDGSVVKVPLPEQSVG